MKRSVAFLIPCAVMLAISVGHSQRARKPKGGNAAVPVAAPKQVLQVVLGRALHESGAISESDFDVAAPQGIKLKDGAAATIEGFAFTYGERNLYEDSAGNPMVVTEYLTEYCMGDTLTPIIRTTIASRTKPGDTAYYDDIHVRLASGKTAKGKPLKFVLR